MTAKNAAACTPWELGAPIIIEMPDMSDKSLDTVIDHVRLFGKATMEYLGRIIDVTVEMLDD